MNKKLMYGMCFVLFVSFAVTQTCFGFTLLTKDQALAEIFGSKAEIITETKELSGDIHDKIKERMGGKLVDMQEGSESASVTENSKVDFHFAAKDGKKYGVAVIEVQPGKWGPIEYIVAMDLKGVVKSVKVMSYQEKRGRPIARKGFMAQYNGKTSSDPITVGKDITGISGATISSRSASFTVKKVIVMYEEIYMKK